MAGQSSDQCERNKASTESNQCGSATRACTTELTIENIRKCQEENNDFKLLSDWKNLGVKPTWNEISEYSPEVKYYWNRWDSVVFDNVLLCYMYIYKNEGNSDYLPIIPRPLVESVLYQMHNTPTSGHLGVKKTQENVRKRFYWKGMSSDVERWIKVCEKMW